MTGSANIHLHSKSWVLYFNQGPEVTGDTWNHWNINVVLGPAQLLLTGLDQISMSNEVHGQAVHGENSQEETGHHQKDQQDSSTHLLNTHSIKSPLRVLMDKCLLLNTHIYGKPSPCLNSWPTGRVRKGQCENRQRLGFPSWSSTAAKQYVTEDNTELSAKLAIALLSGTYHNTSLFKEKFPFDA